MGVFVSRVQGVGYQGYWRGVGIGDEKGGGEGGEVARA